ncbi:hypothetical protein [Paenibacillus roseipurpureus]|uniref:Uncharacterized protein n=1 Tax=Paenibacillus roseopurpureus TaxID=2918901 RepID=A0AA96LP30_9BACL|nr:hypothetical protein [Paenibacillus sp. MBLB1832]WNR43243.1 hypothetical protein MJB10_19310 [Paenibacillus sp. MBLB1832]
MSTSVTIAAFRQKKYHELLLRRVAQNTGKEVEIPYKRNRVIEPRFVAVHGK